MCIWLVSRSLWSWRNRYQHHQLSVLSVDVWEHWTYSSEKWWYRCISLDAILLLQPVSHDTVDNENIWWHNNASAQKLGRNSNLLLAMHSLTVTDTTSNHFKKGKITGLNILKKCDGGIGCLVSHEHQMQIWYQQALLFLLVCMAKHEKSCCFYEQSTVHDICQK